MKREIIVTSDNSKSLLIPELNETYHSINGAANEARHIFIENGLCKLSDINLIRIFEVGFGTGLNSLLSLNYAKNTPIYIAYETVEKFPLDIELINQLNHPQTTNLAELSKDFEMMHTCVWDKTVKISELFSLKKIKDDLQYLNLPEDYYNIIYFDAFSPKIQPELWSTPVLKKMFSSLVNGGRLVTYCAQGQFKRNLKEAGFKVENVPGPSGKREMTIAIKSLVNR